MRVQTAIRKVMRDFAWLRQPYHWLMLIGLLLLSIGLGIWAYQKPLVYTLDVGGADAPFVRDIDSRNIVAGQTSRWLRGESAVSLPGINASHPLTLNVHLSGAGRADVQAGQAVSFTVSVGGHSYPAQRLPLTYTWFSWRVDPALIQAGRLDATFNVPTQVDGILIWPAGMLLDQVIVEPGAEAGQPVADYAELDWRDILYLAVIVLLVYSFFAAARRWLILVGLLVSALLLVALATLLLGNRPLFIIYASSIALALLVMRLLLPLIRGAGLLHPIRWLFLLTLATGLLFLTPDFQSSDDAIKYMTTESLLTRGTLALPPPQRDQGSLYSRYGLGHSIADAPLLALGLAAQQLNGGPDSERYFFALLLNPLMSAVAVVLLFLCARRMFGSERLAIALSLVYFFATFAFVYAAQSWSEPIVAATMALEGAPA